MAVFRILLVVVVGAGREDVLAVLLHSLALDADGSSLGATELEIVCPLVLADDHFGADPELARLPSVKAAKVSDAASRTDGTDKTTLRPSHVAQEAERIEKICLARSVRPDDEGAWAQVHIDLAEVPPVLEQEMRETGLHARSPVSQPKYPVSTVTSRPRTP